jgi:hypothetical protein
MTPEELEEHDFVDHTAELPMIPSWYGKKLVKSLSIVPDEQCEAAFRARKPATGFSREELGTLRKHALSLLPVQQRLLFRLLQNTLVINLISCNGARSTDELITFLEDELRCGQVSPIPAWYSFKHAAERGYGYHVCSARECFATESVECRFLSCGVCRIAYYCGTECQAKDWNQRHKFVCSEAKRVIGKEEEEQYLLKMLEDPNMAGARHETKV